MLQKLPIQEDSDAASAVRMRQRPVVYLLPLVFLVTEEGRYGCVKCGSSYKNKKHLKSHMEYECGVERKFECDKCEKKFKHRKHLNRHVATKVCQRL
ncbi:hypothetical protein HUJ05_009024 [Dendroctonus ponderosae]|nr:hypothetical protein HUJ05_009024 [Dendroctonus ponderosae]